MPLSRPELEALNAIDISYPIPEPDLSAALSSPPFIPSRSLINIRDLGAVPGSALPARRFFRCGNLSNVAADPDAVAWLSANVKRIFDLRKPDERAKSPSPDIPGVENVWFDQQGAYPNPSLDEFAVGDGRGEWGKQYLIVLDMYAPTIRAVLEHVRDRPSEPFLFHCTAGRDRTGVVAGLLQSLGGTSTDDVILDYMLSRIGIEVAREKLTQFALGSLGIADPTTPGFWNMASLRPVFWTAFLEGVEERYGGWDGYVTKGLRFSEDDVRAIKENLRS
ncbi:protein-tyrosine phosphatase-like protein [Thelonectria olida]|uniref:Protein-tyrosine phosphatase-like protein n=1 Tax=Thelonectria olida TaxID=1576542 RepID=A0A9P8WIJ1_9HYPO|nr:protein-tyrosine phosphatase-like protein [Thelonectria olida]